MTFNEEELLKIQKATSGWFKKRTRNAISEAISRYSPEIDAAKKLSEEERKKSLMMLVNLATGERHAALQSGANSYAHVDWAAAAVIESWLHELLNGRPDSISRVETIIQELQKNA